MSATTTTEASGTAALPTTYYPVVATSRQNHDTVTVTVDAAAAPVSFAPGQFSMVYVHGVGEAPISISSDPGQRDLVDHTLRDIGGVTGALTAMNPGDTIGLRGPFGRPWPLDLAQGRDLVIVAGGIGLAPVRPALLTALAHRDRYRSVTLLYGARSPSDLVFTDDLTRWQIDDRIEVGVTVDRAERGWVGQVGLVTKLVDRGGFDPARTVVFTCGPTIMMQFVARSALARGVPLANVWVTLERNMRCAVGTCGHCQLGTVLVCRDGPVFPLPAVRQLLEVREL